MWPIHKEKADNRHSHERSQISDLSDKDFKEVITNMFQELKENSLKEELRGIITMPYQRDRNYLKRSNVNFGDENYSN